AFGCAAGVGASADGPGGRSCRRLLPLAHRLHKPRRETTWNEPYALDDHGHYYSQRSGHHPLLPSAATAQQRVPAMWECRANGIQLLPALQLQTEPQLSAVPARGWG